MSNETIVKSSCLPNLLNFATDEKDCMSSEFALQVLELGNFEEKWVASKVLVKYGEIVIPHLRKIILDENINTESRWYGLKILSQIKHPEIILIVTELLANTQEEDLISLATETLASQGKNSISFLEKLLINSDYRLLATKALAQIPSLNVIEPLLSVVNDHDSTIRTIALSSLRNFDTPQITEILIKALTDYASEVRKEAVIGLGLKLKTTEDLELVKLIIPLLQDINLSVAHQTAIALSRSKSLLAMDALYDSLHAPLTPESLKITIVRALGWITTPQSVEYLAKSISLTDLPVTLEIIAVLGRLNHSHLKSQATDILTMFYHRCRELNNTQILQALCYSFKQLNSIESMPILKQLATHHNLQISLYAQSALKQLNSVEIG